MRETILMAVSLVLIMGGLTGCETSHRHGARYDGGDFAYDTLEYSVKALALPGEVIMMGVLLPTVPFTLAYNASMADERAAYNARASNQAKYDYYTRQDSKPRKSGPKVGTRLWKQR